MGSSSMLRCCCVGWRAAGQDFLLGYLFHLNVNNKENNPNKALMFDELDKICSEESRENDSY